MYDITKKYIYLQEPENNHKISMKISKIFTISSGNISH